MQQFPTHKIESVKNSAVESIAILGTIHHRRWRWNPFDKENEMDWNPTKSRWEYTCFLDPNGGRHGDGVYVCRMIINHNMRRVLKGKVKKVTKSWLVEESSLGTLGKNISFSVSKQGEYTLILNAERNLFWLEGTEDSSIEPYLDGTTYQLNGFPWDDADMFTKFDETQDNRDFQQLNEQTWEITIPLKRNGGIDFRADGVYQFLISTDKNEDLGLAALNHSVSADRRSISLVTGTGFGSSHGTCEHSAPTIRVMEDGIYRFVLSKNNDDYQLSIEADQGDCPKFLNGWSSVHLLGTVHDKDQFDPGNEKTLMTKDPKSGVYHLDLEVDAGEYVINFGLGGELFLDTMALGCWLERDKAGNLKGIAWHGKPNESNICFLNKLKGIISFTYDTVDDSFTIGHSQDNACVQQVYAISTLSLVGSFDSPMQAWDPASASNVMRCVGDTRYERVLLLEAGREYQYKLVGNRSDWHLVFADYELDGYGMTYIGGQNPTPFDTTLSELKHFGHLTSHGNPPAIRFIPSKTGLHRFMVDLRTGAYSVLPISVPEGVRKD